MKHNVYLFTTALAAFTLTISSCTPNGGSSKPKGRFGYYISLNSGKTNLTKGLADKIKITETNPDSTVRDYTFTVVSGSPNYVEVDEKEGTINPKEITIDPVVIRAYESKSRITRTLTLDILDDYEKANGGYNFSTRTQDKTKIMGELEKFAMNNFLTGITLFENGGYVKYSSRVTVKPDSYITGYGFGLLGEGSISGTLPGGDVSYGTYLQSASSSDPLKINAWNATGSQVSDLNSYITSSYFSTRLTKDSKNYEWFPCLAQDTTNVKAIKDGVIVPTATANEPQNRPVPVYSHDDENEKGLYKRWRIYLKTGNSTNGLQYHTNTEVGPDPEKPESSLYSEFDGRNIVLEDYLTPFKVLLSEPTGLVRGAELATDTTYGIKGGYSFYRKTTDKDNDIEFINSTFNNMMNSGELGLKIGTDDNGSYFEFELINPVDAFTAMYTMSSNLYSPLPQAFLEKMATGQTGDDKNWIPAAVAYGTFSTKLTHEGFTSDTSSTRVMASHTLSVGPYFLQHWDKDQQIVFKLNSNWFERDAAHNSRYSIPGVRIRTITDAQSNDRAIYNQFVAGNLDSTGIPMGVDRTGAKQTKGDSTFKLNVNACDQDRWNALFGKNGSIKKGQDNEYTVNPAMHNNNFLRGLFWSINREEFAEKRGVNPSYNYFADAYLSDPDLGTSYNSTQAHKDAVTNFGIDIEQNDYGYNPGKAKSYFKMAISELLNEGAIHEGDTINLRIQWMYPNDETEYGQDIANYFTEQFNNCGDTHNIKLTVTHTADQEWEQVYNDHLMVGKFDLGFGAISGNTLNPLNFMEVLKSDNSSGFTLNWGADTGKVDPKNPITYDGKEWTYDSLWAAADHGVITNDKAEDVDPIQKAYVDSITALDEQTVTSDLRNGGYITVPVDFVEIPNDSVEFDIPNDGEHVKLYLAGAEPFVIDKDNLEIIKKTVIIKGVEKEVICGIKIKITADQAGHAVSWDEEHHKWVYSSTGSINEQIYTGLKLQKKIDDLVHDADYETNRDKLLHPFTKGNYDICWSIEINYVVKIKGALPIEQTFYVASNESEAIKD